MKKGIQKKKQIKPSKKETRSAGEKRVRAVREKMIVDFLEERCSKEESEQMRDKYIMEHWFDTKTEKEIRDIYLSEGFIEKEKGVYGTKGGKPNKKGAQKIFWRASMEILANYYKTHKAKTYTKQFGNKKDSENIVIDATTWDGKYPVYVITPKKPTLKIKQATINFLIGELDDHDGFDRYTKEVCTQKEMENLKTKGVC